MILCPTINDEIDDPMVLPPYLARGLQSLIIGLAFHLLLFFLFHNFLGSFHSTLFPGPYFSFLFFFFFFFWKTQRVRVCVRCGDGILIIIMVSTLCVA